MDLVNLGHCAIAEEVMGSQKLPNCEPITYHGAELAFACGVYLLNHKSDFAEAGRIFGQVWEAARASATDRAQSGSPPVSMAVAIAAITPLSFLPRM